MKLLNYSRLSDERILELFERQHRGDTCDIKELVARNTSEGLTINVYYCNGYVAHCVWFKGEF